MILGFTGSPIGMTNFQKQEYVKFLTTFDPDAFRQGDCIGSDSQAHFLFLEWHTNHDTKARTIFIHPPSNPKKRAFTDNFNNYPQALKENLANCKYKIIIQTLEPKPYLIRNVDIVESSDKLIATPKEMAHSVRSGTWYTVRRAWKKRGMQVIVIPPLVIPERLMRG